MKQYFFVLDNCWSDGDRLSYAAIATKARYDCIPLSVHLPFHSIRYR